MKDSSSSHKKYNVSKVWKRALSAGLGFFILGFSLNIFNSSQTCVSSILNWGHDAEFYIALMTALGPFGALFGALLIGYLSKYYGKRTLMIYSDILTIIGGAINYYPSTINFAIGRFTLGFASGCFSILTPQYVSEFTPPEIYSKMGLLGPLNAMVGNLIGNLSCQLLPENGCDDSNKYFIFLIFIFPLIVALFQLFIFIKIYTKESPGYLLRSKKIELAYQSNESIFGTSYADKEMDKIQKLLQNGDQNNAKDYTFIDLIRCTKGTTKGMRVGCMVHLYQQISGINCVIMYSTLLYLDIGEGLMFARTLTSVGTFARILTVVSLLPIIGKLNTKGIFIVGHFVMGSNLFIIAWIFDIPDLKFVAVGNIFLYLMAFGASIGPLCWSYTSQVMPDKGMAIGTGINWFACTLSVLFFPFLIDLIELKGAFLLFSAMNFSAVAYFLFDGIDIRGKTKQEVREIFSKSR